MNHQRNPDSGARGSIFELPPDDWNPLEATNDVLLKYGYPRRPNAHTHPGLLRLWTEVMARKPSAVQAKLGDPIRRRSDPFRRHQGPDFGVLQYSWGGVQVGTRSLGFPAAEPAMYVSAKWQVPAIWPAAPKNPEQMLAAFWVGLDGLSTNTVLQAGIQVVVDPDPLRVPPTWSAFTEWYPDPNHAKFIDFPVRTGDVVGVVVCADSPTTANAWFYNYSINEGTPACPIEASGDVRLIGDSAEWIAEGGTDELPVFCPMSFTECIAATTRHEFNLQGGDITEIQSDSGGGNLTNTSIVSPTTAVIDWIGWS